jgi:hypothetical protein
MPFFFPERDTHGFSRIVASDGTVVLAFVSDPYTAERIAFQANLALSQPPSMAELGDSINNAVLATLLD